MPVHNRHGGRFHVEWRSPIPLTEMQAEAETEVPADSSAAMDYDEMRALAKTLHISQAGKKEVLRDRLAAVRPGTPTRVPVVPLSDLSQLAQDIGVAINTVARLVPDSPPGETQLVIIDSKPYWRIRWFASMAIGARLARLDPRFRPLRSSDL